MSEKFFERNLDFPKIKFVLMSELAQKCANNFNAILRKTLKQLIAYKMAYSCCLSLG